MRPPLGADMLPPEGLELDTKGPLVVFPGESFQVQGRD